MAEPKNSKHVTGNGVTLDCRGCQLFGSGQKYMQQSRQRLERRRQNGLNYKLSVTVVSKISPEESLDAIF